MWMLSAHVVESHVQSLCYAAVCITQPVLLRGDK